MRRVNQENYFNRTEARPGIVRQLSNTKGKVAIWRTSLLQIKLEKPFGKKETVGTGGNNVYIPLTVCEK